MTLRELVNELTDLLVDGYGDCEVVVGNANGGKPVRVVELRNAGWCGGEYVYCSVHHAFGCISRVIRISSRQP